MSTHRGAPASSDPYRPVIYLDEDALPAEAMKAALAAVERAGRGGVNRILVHLRSDTWVAKVCALAAAGLPLQLFTDDRASAALPGVIQFPSGSSPLDVEAFGLAMSDAVAVAAPGAETTLAGRARVIGKPLVTPDRLTAPVAELLDPADPAGVEAVRRSLRELDPEFAACRHPRVLRNCGRIDSILTDLMAGTHKLLAPSARERTPVPPSKHFRRALEVARRFPNASYFAPNWDALYPSADLPVRGPMIGAFDWLDRAATAGARLYRDMVWAIHACAFTAVFSAVAGTVVDSEILPALFEGLSLLGVVSLYARAKKLHTLWAACRVGAEQLRVARMALPLLVVPPVLLGIDRDPDAEAASRLGEVATGREKAVVLALVKRALREQGPSAIRQPPSVERAAAWLRHIVSDQLTYHERNHDKLEAVERFETRFNAAVFCAVALAVAYEIMGWAVDLPDTSWLLLLTAGGPAAVSAFHGASVRMEIRRRAELSRLYADKLRPIANQLDRIVGAPEQSSWAAIRELVTRATIAMGSEADDWHSAVLLAPVALP